MSLHSIQNQLAGRYYELASQATTPEQINALKQHIAQSVQNGNLPSYEGIPLIASLNQTAAKIGQESQIAAGQANPAPPPVGKQVMATVPQRGIDSAESNLPESYAGGGIVAFAGGGDTAKPQMEMFEDPTSGETYERPVSSGNLFSDWADRLKAKAQGTYVPPAAPVAAPAPAAPAKQDSGIIIHDTPKAAPRVGAPAAPAAPAATDSLATGIDKLLESGRKNREDLKSIILGDKSEQQKQLEQNLWLSLLKGGFKAAGGTSPFALANIGPGGEAAAEGIAGALHEANTEKARQVQQLVQLGLKGEELDTELAKLGITREYYNMHAPALAAEARYKNAMANYVASGKGGAGAGGKGSVPGAVVQSELNALEGYKANPATAPFFKSLPQDVQMAITKTAPGTGSYQRGMEVFDQYANQYIKGRLATIQSYGVKQPSLGSDI